MSAFELTRSYLANEGYLDLAEALIGGDTYVVRPAKPLAVDEARAFLAARRKAYIAIGLVPCSGQCDCEHDDEGCFADGEAWYAQEFRRLTDPKRRGWL